MTIPLSVIDQLEHEMNGVCFGGVSLIIAIRDGQPSFRIEKTLSIIPPDTNGTEKTNTCQRSLIKGVTHDT